MIYLIGSLRNPEVPIVAEQIRARGYEVFDDWYAAGPEADDMWQRYENGRCHDFQQALQGHAAQNVFLFDHRHLQRCEAAILLLPAGKSGHLELGWVLGRGKPGFIVYGQEPERYDVMYNFATRVFRDVSELLEDLPLLLPPWRSQMTERRSH